MVDDWLRNHTNHDLITATTADYDAWLTWLRTTPIPGTDRVRSPGTRRTYLANLRAWADDAELTGWIDRNPAARLRVPRPAPAEEERRPVFPPAVIALALRFAVEPVKTWLILGLYMGLRIGECRRIRREDIDELGTPPTIYVRGKGRRHARMPVSDEVLTALLPWLRSNRRGLLFRDRRGGEYDRRAASRMVSVYLRSVGIPPPITMHSTRHYAISTAIHAGYRPTAVQQFARHACLSSTMIYTHEVPDAVREIVAGLGLDLGRVVEQPALRVVRDDESGAS